MNMVGRSKSDVRPSSQNDETTLTAFQRLSNEHETDEQVIQDITLGKRTGLYAIKSEIGHGNFSTVRVAVHLSTNETVALKILDKTKLDAKTQKLLSREIANMERMHHPNIIRLYEVVETPTKLHIALELAPFGELYTKITSHGKLEEALAKQLFAQLVAGVNHIHSMNIIHRDIKAENVFFSAPEVIKIGDFGFSTKADFDQMLNTFCGSPPYAAPELFRDETYLGSPVDLWALGVLLFFMLTAMMPFRADNVSRLKKCILDGSYSTPDFMSPTAGDLIGQLLTQTPLRRATLKEVMLSKWLRTETFPNTYVNNCLTPKHLIDPDLRDADEIAVRDQLYDLGVTKKMIQNCADDARSNVVGTYRILLHKQQRLRFNERGPYHLNDSSLNFSDNLPANLAKNDSAKQKHKSRKSHSRVCAII